MGSRIFFIILLLLVCYFYHESIVDIALNFGIYFPFLNTTTYLDLIKHVAIPKFKSDSDENLFTVDELKTYNGENSNLLYISILGQVFDVSKASSYYGVNQVYHGFTGKKFSIFFLFIKFLFHLDVDSISNYSSHNSRITIVSSSSSFMVQKIF